MSAEEIIYIVQQVWMPNCCLSISPNASNTTTTKFYNLTEVGVQFSNTVGQLLNVLCQQLVSIRNTIVKIWHLVVRETPANPQYKFLMHT